MTTVMSQSEVASNVSRLNVNVGSIPSISSSAMLVELNISTWTGRKFDKTVSAEIDVQKQTTTRAGNYHKKLFADEPKFDAVGKFAGGVRTYHYYATMPWSDSGLRLLTTAMYFDYQKRITEMESEFKQLVADFLADYDLMVARAQIKLGTLFNEEDYPTKDEILERYRFSVKYSPVPSVGDWRVDVGNDAQQQLNMCYAQAYVDNLQQALAEPWERMHEALKNMSERLAGEKKQIFRDSLVNNVLDLCTLLDKFNVTGDAGMKQAKARIENILLGVTPDALREDDDLRLDTKSKVDALLKEMSW
jgi:hypothetical protein